MFLLWGLTVLLWLLALAGTYRLAASFLLRRSTSYGCLLALLPLALSLLVFGKIVWCCARGEIESDPTPMWLATAFFGVTVLAFRPGFVLANPWLGPVTAAENRLLGALAALIALNFSAALGVIAAQVGAWPVPTWLIVSAVVFWFGTVSGVIWFWYAHGSPAELLSRLGGRPWSATPFEGRALASPGRTQLPSPDPTFDIFLSYKSQDVSVVRRVGDLLIAAGVRVWFAEYFVLLTKRSRFSEAIDAGMRHSRYGVAFTSDRYIGSKWCRHELEYLLDPARGGAGRVLEIRMRDESETHRQFPALAQSPCLDYQGDVATVLHFLHRVTRLPLVLPPSDLPSEPRLFRDSRLGYSLDLVGWKLLSKGGDAAPAGLTGPRGAGRLGGHNVTWNLVIGTNPPAEREAAHLAQQVDENDDRECYEQMMRVASWQTARMGVRCAGVHLILDCRGVSHLALTFWYHHFWCRRYSIVLPDPRVGRSTEFVFEFQFHGPFEAYCGQAEAMDRLVASLEWSG